jgi:hypothetical protein
VEPQGPVVCGEDVLFRASSYGVFLMPDGSHRSHYGVDLYAADGTEVRSPVEGVVDRVGYASNRHEIGGNCVRIKDLTREYHYAAHMLTPPLVRRGDAVQIGTPLGWVGKTGSAHGTHSHTHYEWRDRLGRVKNPFNALVRAYGQPDGTRVVRGAMACPGGPLGCEMLAGDATAWCDQARVALLEKAKLDEEPPEVPESPESTTGMRPVRWDILAGVGVLTGFMFGAVVVGRDRSRS